MTNIPMFNKFTINFIIILLISLIFQACSTTKFVNEGEYLLDNVFFKSDVKDVDTEELSEYLRQSPNSTVLKVYKMPLHIYNLAPRDSSKGLSKFFRSIGEAPVIYDPILTKFSADQLQLLIRNKGYVNARVDTALIFKNKKVNVKYLITSNKPYKIRKYSINSGFKVLDSIAVEPTKTLVKSGAYFDIDVLSAERERITSQMRNMGYYNFVKDFLVYTADSALNSFEIDIKLDIKTNLKSNIPVSNWPIFKQYKINKVYFVLNRTDIVDSVKLSRLDTIEYKNNYLIDIEKKFISLDALVHNSYIEPQSFYKDIAVEKTYSSLNSLAPVKYVNISFKETEHPNDLDSYIYIVPGKTVGLSAEAKITLTKGYLGGEGQIGLMDKNLFGGGETFSTQLRVAAERQNVEWANEYGVQFRLMFPKFMFPVGNYDWKRRIHANTEFTTNFTFQNRPNEFSTTNLTGGVNYTWAATRFQHKFELFNLSYVYFPTIDSTFRARYISPGLYNKYNYEDHLIMRLGYNMNYTTRNPNRPLRNYVVNSLNIETAGNLLYMLNSVFKTEKQADGYYKLFNVRYAQYVRGEYNTSYNQIFDKNNRIVYHLGMGLGVPFGNADIIPYERRFYSGGANSVRGWNESRLGPGTYKSIVSNDISRDYNQVGDVKLDMNIEYRSKLFWVLEGALFLDAGNVWTIKDYTLEQPGGQFKLKTFPEQIALAYGAGARLDFSFFLIRFDLGVQLYDPAEAVNNRWVTDPKWKDFAFHLAIGYPF